MRTVREHVTHRWQCLRTRVTAKKKTSEQKIASYPKWSLSKLLLQYPYYGFHNTISSLLFISLCFIHIRSFICSVSYMHVIVVAIFLFSLNSRSFSAASDFILFYLHFQFECLYISLFYFKTNSVSLYFVV